MKTINRPHDYGGENLTTHSTYYYKVFLHSAFACFSPVFVFFGDSNSNSKCHSNRNTHIACLYVTGFRFMVPSSRITETERAQQNIYKMHRLYIYIFVPYYQVLLLPVFD